MRRGWMLMVGDRLGPPSVIAVLALTVVLGGCRPSPADSAPLQGTQWVLVTLEGKPPLTGATPSAKFSADQISGSTGCNHYFGEYAVSSGDITIRDLARTERYCMDPEGVMDQEEAVLNALISATSYRVAGARLKLLDVNDDVVLVFEPAAAVPES